MIRFRLPFAVLLLAVSSIAMASSASMSSNAISGAIQGSSNGASASSGSSSSDDRIVLAARDDAASFVASEGAIRGVQLEAALVLLRTELPAVRDASDLALAQAILAL